MVALVVFCGSAQAATFTVNSSGDGADATLNGTCATAGAVCTLRAAIQESNFSTPVADTITFTAAAQPTINLTGPLPDIADALTISGPGAAALTVRRNTAGAYRIFTISGDVDVTISGLTVRNGLSDATTTPAASGGAIAFVGTSAGGGSLSLSAVTVTANSATSATPTTNVDGAVVGGGISVLFGDLTVAGSTITNNTASATGTATGARGGGIHVRRALAFPSAGATALTNVTVTGNSASLSGDGSASGGGIDQLAGETFVMSGGSLGDNTSSVAGTSGGAASGGGAAMTQVANITLTNVPVAGNDATANGGDFGAANGGGISVPAAISFEMSGGALSDNTASVSGAADSGAAFGGGADLAPVQTVALTNVAVTGNDATVSGAASGNAFGGGIEHAAGTSFEMSGGEISDNAASVTGASSIAVASGGGATMAQVESITLTNVSVAGNDATAGGGDFGNASGGGIDVPAAGSFEMTSGAIRNNTASVSGASLNGVVFGGGANFSPVGTVTLTNVPVTGNDATVSGAASGDVFGGGIQHAAGTSFAMSGGAIADNTAGVTGASSHALASGGGAALADVSTSSLTNSTVSGNEATASGGAGPVERGGGIDQGFGGTLALTAATLAFNEAATGANLVANGSETTVRARNTIVSDPVGGANCAELDSGDIVSDGFNLSSDVSCGFTAGGDQQNVDPDLGPLADNGGPTFTHALPVTSPALDKGSSAASGSHPALTTDQRGAARPVDLPAPDAAGGDGSDIGAFEHQAYAGIVLADAPVGYWRFGEPSGLTAFDSSPNGNDGTYVNGPVLGVPGALAGDPDTAVRLDGVNDNVRVPDDNTLDVGDTFSAEGWIKRSSTAQTHTMMVKGFQITVMSAANGNQVWLRKTNVSTIARTTTAGVAAGAYHHVVVTKNGAGPGAVKIYIDGAPVTVLDVSAAQVIPNTTGPLLFGSAASTPADFDEFALYDQVLTPAQIDAHHDAGVPGG